MPEVTLVEAINLALARAMEDDPNVVVFGEDVGVNGSVFRATVGLQQRFGTGTRVRYAAAELLISGLCVGMAAQGLRPSARSSSWDYLSMHRSIGEPCLAAAQPHEGGSAVRWFYAPRMVAAFAPEHHSESTEAMLAHIPGLRVVIPSSPERAYGLCSPPSATPIRWCSWSRRASTAPRKARWKTTARSCHWMSPLSSGRS